MAQFFAMGGYALYVWGAYAAALVVMVALLVASLRGLRARQAVASALEAARGRRRKRS